MANTENNESKAIIQDIVIDEKIEFDTDKEECATVENQVQDFSVCDNSQSEKGARKNSIVSFFKRINPFRIDKSLFQIQDKSGKLNLFAITFPAFLQLIINNLLGVINTIMFANYDPAFITATNASNRLLGFISTIVVIASIGLSINLAHAMGRNDKREIDHLTFNAFVLVTSFSLVFIVISLIFAKPLLTIFHLEGEILEMATTHFRWNTVPVYLLTQGTSVFNSTLKCHGYNIISVITTISRVGLGVLSNALFINTALGSYLPMIYNVIIVSYISGAIAIGVSFIEIKCRKIKIGHELDFTLIKKILRIGGPASISNISYTLSSLITASIITIKGSYYLNIKAYVDSIVVFVGYLSSSFGSSCAVFVGRMVGAQDFEKANKMHYDFMKAILLINTTLSLLVLVLHKPLYSLFDQNPQSFAIILPVFIVDVVVEIGRAMNHIEQNTLNGAGDVKYTTAVSILSCWVCAVGGGWLFAIGFDLGLVGCYIAAALDEWTRAFLSEKRWRSGKWKHYDA